MVAARQQRFGDGKSDESGGTGDENAHDGGVLAALAAEITREVTCPAFGALPIARIRC